MVIYDTPEGHHTAMEGSYRSDPAKAIRIATLALQQLFSYEARKRFDPLTASDNLGRGK